MILWQFVTAHATSWLTLLADGSVRATVALTAAAITVGMARRTSAAWRHLVWTVGICAALCLPVLSGVFPGWQVCALRLPASRGAVRVAAAPSPRISAAPAAAPSSPLQAAATIRTATNASRPLPPARPAAVRPNARPAPRAPVLLMLLWGLGALVAAAPVLVGTASRWRMAARSRPARELAWEALLGETRRQAGAARRIRLLLGAGETVPMVWGWMRPTVLLPASAADWTEERRRLVLLHELAHVKRADCLLQSFVHLACALYWFHPLVWLAAHRLRHERERACDDVVLAAGEKASDYAAHLLALTRALRAPRLAGVAAVPMARAAGMGKRIQDLLDAGRARGAITRRAKLTIAFAAAALLLPLAGVHAFAATTGTQLVPAGHGPGGQALYTWEVGQSWAGGEQYDTRLDQPVQFWDAGLTLADVFAAISKQTGVTLGFWPEGSENPRVRVNLYLNPQQPPTLRELMAQLAWVTDCTFGISREEKPRYYLLSTSAGTAAAESLRQQEARRKEEVTRKVQAFKDKANEVAEALQLPRDEAIRRYRGSDDRMLLTLLDPARRGAALIFCRRVIPMLVEPTFGPEHPNMGIGVPLNDLTEEEQAALRAAFGLSEATLRDPSLGGGAIVDADWVASLMPPMVMANGAVVIVGSATSNLVLFDMSPGAHLEPEEEITLRRLLGETIGPEQERTYVEQRSAELAAARRARRQQSAAGALSPSLRDRLAQTPLPLPDLAPYPAWRVQEAVAQATGLHVVSDGLLHASTAGWRTGITALGAIEVLCLQGRPGEVNRGTAPPIPEWEWGDAGAFLRFRTRSRDVWRAALLPQPVVDWLDGQLRPLLPAQDAAAADLTLPVVPEQWTRQTAGLTDIQIQYAAEVVHADPRTLAELARRAAWEDVFRISYASLPTIRFLGSLDSDQWKQAQSGELRWPRSVTPDQGKLLAQALADPGAEPANLRRYSAILIALTEVAPGDEGQLTTVTTMVPGGAGYESAVSMAHGPKEAKPVNWYAVTFTALVRDQATGKETTGLEKRIAFLPKAITIHAEVPK